MLWTINVPSLKRENIMSSFGLDNFTVEDFILSSQTRASMFVTPLRTLSLFQLPEILYFGVPRVQRLQLQ